MVSHLDEDPLLQLAGVFECNITNVSDFHDEYIGQALKSDNESSWHCIVEALTTDPHFEQAGFRKSLKFQMITFNVETSITHGIKV